MLSQTLIDTLVILSLFILRIGVPIVLTLAFGYWLEKKLAPQETVRRADSARILRFPLAPHAAKSTVVENPHCWDIQQCDPAKRAECSAFKRPELPCWLALQADGSKLREACFTCDLYTQPYYRVAI